MGGDRMNDEANMLRMQKQFTDLVDHIVHDKNREVIHAVIPRLDRATFSKMAHSVANLRVKYIALSVQLASAEPFTPQMAGQLKAMREQFEEARAGFDAVKRAIIRGYIDLAD